MRALRSQTKTTLSGLRRKLGLSYELLSLMNLILLIDDIENVVVVTHT